MITYSLQATGFKACGLTDGKELFQALENSSPELILLDIMLPDIDGLEILTKLKNKKRQGWIYWNVTADRIESIAEHIFGAEQLAWLIYSEAELDLDIYKVISMLSLHETEEITIGDITPFDQVSREEKKRRGHIAIEETFKNLFQNEMMINLIKEFLWFSLNVFDVYLHACVCCIMSTCMFMLIYCVRVPNCLVVGTKLN